MWESIRRHVNSLMNIVANVRHEKNQGHHKFDSVPEKTDDQHRGQRRQESVYFTTDELAFGFPVIDRLRTILFPGKARKAGRYNGRERRKMY